MTYGCEEWHKTESKNITLNKSKRKILKVLASRKLEGKLEGTGRPQEAENPSRELQVKGLHTRGASVAKGAGYRKVPRLCG